MNSNTCITITTGALPVVHGTLKECCSYYGVNASMSAIRVAKALDKKGIILLHSSYLRTGTSIYNPDGLLVANMMTLLPSLDDLPITLIKITI